MRILLAVDGSECSETAVREVARRPWPQGSEIRLVTVVATWQEDLARRPSPGYFNELNQHLRADAASHIAWAESLLREAAPGLAITSVLRDGLPKEAILDEAEKWQADLIVLGSHGYGTIRRLFLGSVSLAVATNATCSVEIVRSPAQTSAPSENP